MLMRTFEIGGHGLCTVQTVASDKRVSAATVRRWIKAGRLSVAVVGAGKREVWLLLSEEVANFRAPRKGRAGPSERDRRRRLELQSRRVALASAGLPWTKKRAAVEDETVLALARRIRDGDESATIPLVDRFKELGRDRDAELVRRNATDAVRTLLGE